MSASTLVTDVAVACSRRPSSFSTSFAMKSAAALTLLSTLCSPPIASASYVVTFVPTLESGVLIDFGNVDPGPLLPVTEIQPGVLFVEAPDEIGIAEAVIVVAEGGEHVIQYAAGEFGFSQAISFKLPPSALGLSPRAVRLEVRRIYPPFDAPGNPSIRLYNQSGDLIHVSSLVESVGSTWTPVQVTGTASSDAFTSMVIRHANTASPELYQFRSILLGAIVAADLTLDGRVDGADLGELLAMWGNCPECPADLNGDGIVDGADLGDLLSAWTISG